MPVARIFSKIVLYWGIWMATISPALPADTTLKEVSDFQALGEAMQAKKLPLLLAFRADYCGFCKRLETEYLEPMAKSGDYDSRILIRTFNMGDNRTVTDFNGAKIDAEKMTHRYKVSLTPTLIFLNADGKEIAEPLLGYNSPDFYGAYLENAIDTAHKAINEKGR